MMREAFRALWTTVCLDFRILSRMHVLSGIPWSVGVKKEVSLRMLKPCSIQGAYKSNQLALTSACKRFHVGSQAPVTRASFFEIK